MDKLHNVISGLFLLAFASTIGWGVWDGAVSWRIVFAILVAFIATNVAFGVAKMLRSAIQRRRGEPDDATDPDTTYRGHGGDGSVFRFGKYEGYSVSQIVLRDPGYLEWALSTKIPERNPELGKAMRAALSGRSAVARTPYANASAYPVDSADLDQWRSGLPHSDPEASAYQLDPPDDLDHWRNNLQPSS